MSSSVSASLKSSEAHNNSGFVPISEATVSERHPVKMYKIYKCVFPLQQAGQVFSYGVGNKVNFNKDKYALEKCSISIE